MPTISRLFGKLTTLIKAILVAIYNSIMNWAASTRARDPSECFSSSMIHPSDPAVRAKIKYLHRGYEDEERYKKMILAVIGYTMVTYDGLASVINQIRFCEENDIAGAYVELGTWKGGSFAVMAQANLAYGKLPRHMHGFDSFQGLPAPRADKDFDSYVAETFKITREQSDGSLKPIGALLSEQSDVEVVLEKVGYPRDHVHLHAGWFQDTVPVVGPKIGPIAILRLDGDLYESYLIALDHLWDQVVIGGFVIFDDWVYKGCRDAVTEFFAKRGLHEYICYADATVRYVRKSG
jgi:hypothetical protein